MKRFDHKNIVKLLGVCTKNEPVYTVMEFMLYGKQQECQINNLLIHASLLFQHKLLYVICSMFIQWDGVVCHKHLFL